MKTIEEYMSDMPEEWRYNWCSGGACACLGGSNRSGNLSGKFTEEEWQVWVDNNPQNMEEPIVQLSPFEMKKFRLDLILF